MAVANRNSLVLNNVSVVNDVVTSTTGRGTNPASGKPLGIPFSRRQSQGYPPAEQKPSWWQDLADQHGADHAAKRAGRPGCHSRVLAMLSAHPADRASAMRWPLAMDMFCPPAASRLGRFTTIASALAARTLASSTRG